MSEEVFDVDVMDGARSEAVVAPAIASTLCSGVHHDAVGVPHDHQFLS